MVLVCLVGAMAAEEEEEYIARHNVVGEPPHPCQYVPARWLLLATLVFSEAQNPVGLKTKPMEESFHTGNVVDATLQLCWGVQVVDPDQQSFPSPRWCWRSPSNGRRLQAGSY